MNFYTYILHCSDNTLYTGYTDNLENRLNKHNSWTWAKYTRGRLPVSLVFFEEFSSKSEAMKRECEIKKFSRKQKDNLIKNFWKK